MLQAAAPNYQSSKARTFAETPKTQENDMKSIALATALILGIASPVLAASQLEANLGVPAGAYSDNQLAELFTKRHLDSANERAANLSTVSDVSTTVTTRSVHSARAKAIFASLREESREDE